MARLTYSAPGVYVEEIPSAQQPIAGIGTSTAAFIGVVPDQIEYPVRNDKYDPKAAQIAFKHDFFKQGKDPDAEDATEDELKYLKMVLDKWNADLKGLAASKEDTKQLDEERIKLQQELNDVQNQLKKADLAPDKKNELEKRKNELLEQKGKLDIKPSSKATATEQDRGCLKPYLLKTFTVKVDPLVTKLCTNFTEYTERFGSFPADDPKYASHRALTHAVNGFFGNGGSRCFVARVKSSAELEDALKRVASIDEVAIVTAPGLEGEPIWNSLVKHCDNTEDRFAILDSAEVVGSDRDPDLELLTYNPEKSVLPQRSKNAAFYFPWIEVVDPAKQLQDQDPARNIDAKYQGRVYVPPSGHIAGIYARTDVERGVHKAPANCAIAGAINVKYYLSKRHQEGLNPQGVNCIRNINGNIAVWGARTIGGDLNSEWKYINVRRVMLFLRESIDEGTQWVVFEPNDIALWGKIKRNVTAFLTNVWRSGALFGATPEEAFYVKCDAELNPPEVRDLGQVITEIGVAIVRPAEFVIFRISQSTGAKV